MKGKGEEPMSEWGQVRGKSGVGVQGKVGGPTSRGRNRITRQYMTIQELFLIVELDHYFTIA